MTHHGIVLVLHHEASLSISPPYFPLGNDNLPYPLEIPIYHWPKIPLHGDGSVGRLRRQRGQVRLLNTAEGSGWILVARFFCEVDEDHDRHACAFYPHGCILDQVFINFGKAHLHNQLDSDRMTGTAEEE